MEDNQAWRQTHTRPPNNGQAAPLNVTARPALHVHGASQFSLITLRASHLVVLPASGLLSAHTSADALADLLVCWVVRHLALPAAVVRTPAEQEVRACHICQQQVWQLI
jgi:hypothetical protein